MVGKKCIILLSIFSKKFTDDIKFSIAFTTTPPETTLPVYLCSAQVNKDKSDEISGVFLLKNSKYSRDLWTKEICGYL